MGTDEVGTHARLTSDFEVVALPAIARYGGRVERIDGDGMLAEFPERAAAVRAAVAIQTAMPGRNARRAPQRQILFRIGLHAGPIHCDGQMIFGEAVNIAVRLEGCAEPGGICASAAVVRAVVPGRGIRRRDLGPLQLKNIAQPVEAVALRVPPTERAVPLRARRWRRVKRRLAEQRRAAVFALGLMAGVGVPQVDASRELASVRATPAATVMVLRAGGDAGEAVSAITAEIAGALPNYFGIAVRQPLPPLSSGASAAEAGVHARARFVLRLEGAGQGTRATLVDAATARSIWTHRWPAEDRGQISGHVISVLGRGLGPGGGFWAEMAEPQALASDSPVDYREYARGRSLLARVDRAGNRMAQVIFAEVEAHLPYNAPLAADLSTTHLDDYRYGWTDGGRESLAAAIAHARRGAELDPDNFTAARALGLAYLTDRRHGRALDMLNRAVALNPYDAETQVMRAFALSLAGTPSAAAAALPWAGFEPGSGRSAAMRAWVLLAAGQPQAARDALRTARRTTGYSLLLLALAEGQLGDLAAAREALAQFRAREPHLTVGTIARAFPQRDAPAARRFRDKLRRLGLPDPKPAQLLALGAAGDARAPQPMQVQGR